MPQDNALTPRVAEVCALQSTASPGIKIDDGVPLPPPSPGTKGRGITAALRALEVGQSFVVPMAPNGLKQTQAGAGRTAAALRDKKFATRTVMENGERVVRVWRTA